jgi:hypothetical protein
MSNILNSLGIEESELEWFDLALCLNMDTNLFFEKYETDLNIARNIDQACLSCPVISICYEQGKENDDYGVWGGIYLNSGSVDKVRNAHKTKEVWKQLKGIHGIH